MEALIQAALECGAYRATIIPQDQITLSVAFREICKGNGCGMYGRCWMCPPDNGDIHELMAKVRQYPYGLLYQSVGAIEDSFDIEGMQDRGRDHVQLGQRIEDEMRHLLPDGFLHLSSGGCHLCERCAKRDNAPCRYPDRALSSLEGYGVDVYRTTEGTSLKYINGENTVTYFGLVLYGG